MSKRFCRGLAAVLLFCLPALASAADSGWYLALDRGHAQYSHDVYVPLIQVEPPGFVGGFNVETYDDSSSAYRLGAGYRFNRYLAMELSHVDLGYETATAPNLSFPQTGDCGPACENSYTINTKRKARGWSLSLVGDIPLRAGWSVYGSFGYINETDVYDNTVAGTDSPPYGNKSLPPEYEQSASALRSTYGYGVKWAFTDHWTARLGRDYYRDFNGTIAGTVHVLLTSIGIEYGF